MKEEGWLMGAMISWSGSLNGLLMSMKERGRCYEYERG
jgi:hypothetical protein